MCGIAGIIDKTGEKIPAALLRGMTAALAHRGPDGEGIAQLGSCGLGHRRLAVLDLSERGKQPMGYGDLGLTVTHDGKIYNYIELRDELKKLGRNFTTESDAEVILAAYAQWGEDCVHRFNGMWSFAIHDKKKKIMFCARDRFGVKPFYYIDTARYFAFASEIRALLPLLDVVQADLSMVETFIATSAADTTAHTFFKDVQKLPAGHAYHYDLKTHRRTRTQYYKLKRDKDLERATDDYAIDTLRDLLTDAVKLRMRASVKVGTCLSGGLDSSGIAILAATHYGMGMNAITAISEQGNNSEAPYAEQVVRQGKMLWHQVTPNYDDFVTLLPQVVRAQEEPFGGPSLIMQYLVMQQARAQHIPVLLDGQGGDELLLGYARYFALDKKLLRASLFNNNINTGPLALLKFYVGTRHAKWRTLYYRRKHSYLKRPPKIAPHVAAYAKHSADAFALQALEVTSSSLPLLLRYEDKNAMAHGVETRLPFLDHRVVETALSLPLSLKIRHGWSKWLLRRVWQDILPEGIAWRKHKFGFEAPEDLWLPQHEATMKEAVLASPLLQHIADSKKLSARFAALDRRSQFRLYSVALWEKEFGVSV